MQILTARDFTFLRRLYLFDVRRIYARAFHNAQIIKRNPNPLRFRVVNYLSEAVLRKRDMTTLVMYDILHKRPVNIETAEDTGIRSDDVVITAPV